MTFGVVPFSSFFSPYITRKWYVWNSKWYAIAALVVESWKKTSNAKWRCFIDDAFVTRHYSCQFLTSLVVFLLELPDGWVLSFLWCPLITAPCYVRQYETIASHFHASDTWRIVKMLAKKLLFYGGLNQMMFRLRFWRFFSFVCIGTDDCIQTFGLDHQCV